MQKTKTLLCLFLPSYLMSFYLAFSAEHLFILWVGAEVNLISFLGLMKSNNNSFSSSNIMKYFLVQTLGSMLILLSWYLGQLYKEGLSLWYFTLGVFLKLGVFPLHTWFISFTTKITPPELWAVAIPQKLIPLWFLMTSTCFQWAIWGSIILGSAASLTNALPSLRLSTILGFSSVFNTGWLMAILTNLDIFISIFILYSGSLLVVMGTLTGNSLKLQQDAHMFPQPWGLTVLQVIALLNLSGVPPFINLWNKAMMLEFLVSLNLILPAILFILFSAGFVYIYINLFYTNLTALTHKTATWAFHKPPVWGALLCTASALMYFF